MDLPWLRSGEEGISLSARFRKAAASPDPGPLLLACSKPRPPPALKAPELETLPLFVLLGPLAPQAVSSCSSDSRLRTSLRGSGTFLRGIFCFLWGDGASLCGFLGFVCGAGTLFCGVLGLVLASGFRLVYLGFLLAFGASFCGVLVCVRDFVAVLVDDEEVAAEEEEACAESGCGKLFVTVLVRSGWFCEV